MTISNIANLATDTLSSHFSNIGIAIAYNMAASDVLMAPDDNVATSSQFPCALHPSVDEYKYPYKIYLQKHPFYEIKGPSPVNVAISWVIVGALTFHPTSIPARILLIQRSAKDSMPHLWEIPGGGCDEGDESILHSVTRELKEEAGLVPRMIRSAVGQGYVFSLAPGRFTRKINFIVELDGGEDVLDVKLDPDEHEAFVWATEEEIREGKVGDLEIPCTSQAQRDVILQAFELKRLAEGGEIITDSMSA